MTQQEAFLAQARSDYDVYKRLKNVDGLPACHWLHYLQMATEKLAKAIRMAFWATGADKESHVAFSKLLGVLQNAPQTAAALKMKSAAFKQLCRRTQPIIDEIERLAPAVGSGPNVEYPWQQRDAEGIFTWISPIDHAFGVERTLQSPNGDALLKLTELLLTDFERIVGR